MSRQAVTPPPATPPRYGLIAAAPLAPADPALRGVAGIGGWEFNREECGGGNRSAIDCGGGVAPRTVDDEVTGDDIVGGDPFLIWTERHCTTRGFAAADFEGRARRQLAAVESFELANELWTGALRDSTGNLNILDNRALTDPASDTVTNGISGVTPHDALGMLVGGLGICSRGSRGMIHVTPQVLVALATEGTIYRDGNVWLAPMGHIVVADAGYDGTGPNNIPAGATQWAYATSMISLRLGDVEIPGTFSENTDRRRNRVRVYAQRAVGYVWDECCHIAAEIALPVPLVGPPS